MRTTRARAGAGAGEAKSLPLIWTPDQISTMDNKMTTDVKAKSLCGIADLIAAIFGEDPDKVRRNVGAPPKYKTMLCPACGTAFDPRHGLKHHNRKYELGLLYCSPECLRAARTIMVVCDECGKLFPRATFVVVKEAKQHPGKMFFCTRKCFGRYAGKHYGWRIHPENMGRHKKYDKDMVWQKHLATGYGGQRLSRIINVPAPVIDMIIFRMRAMGKVDVPTASWTKAKSKTSGGQHEQRA
ncbi:MAG: hypothetical protein Q8O16_02310 [Dehalococcoidia bacterium]|nr:hypothetical protein [Dehalococcoidia bacterium]